MTDSNMAMASSYDYRLVALSVIIAIFASYAALELAGRTTAARGRVRLRESRVRQFRLSGSVEGVMGNHDSYSD